jgi:hypothetical protein
MPGEGAGSMQQEIFHLTYQSILGIAAVLLHGIAWLQEYKICGAFKFCAPHIHSSLIGMQS